MASPAECRIASHQDSRGRATDLMGSNMRTFIVRSDLGYYLEVVDVNDMDTAEARFHRIHPACSGGDHYVSNSDYTYVIKGDKYRRVNNLSNDSGAVVNDLPAEFRGADFYLSQEESNKEFKTYPFFAIFADRKQFINSEGETKDLHPNCTNGLYYWATEDHFYMIKREGTWNGEFHQCDNLHDDKDGVDLSISPTVCNFLPGGITITLGQPSMRWALIKTISNNSSALPLQWSQDLRKKVGYKPRLLFDFELYWNVNWKRKETIEFFFRAALTAGASMLGKFHTHYEQDWSEESEEVEHFKVTIPVRVQTVYIWQLQIGFGSVQDAISCRDLVITTTPDPPDHNPFAI